MFMLDNDYYNDDNVEIIVHVMIIMQTFIFKEIYLIIIIISLFV